MEVAPTAAGDLKGDTSEGFVEQLVSVYSFAVPHERDIGQEDHIRRGREVYAWLLRNNVVSPGELKEMRTRKDRLTSQEVQTIQFTPQDYWLIATIEGMNPDQHRRFIPLVRNSDFDSGEYFLQQTAWFWTALLNHLNNFGRLPTSEEESELLNSIIGQFRTYWVLKRDVFKERVFYPWARDSKNRLEKIEQEKRRSMGYVTEWQL